MIMALLKLVAIAIFSSLTIVLLAIIFPQYVYSRVKIKRIEKFLEHDLVRACWMLLICVICTLSIVGFINFLN